MRWTSRAGKCISAIEFKSENGLELAWILFESRKNRSQSFDKLTNPKMLENAAESPVSRTCFVVFRTSKLVGFPWRAGSAV